MFFKLAGVSMSPPQSAALSRHLLVDFRNYSEALELAKAKLPHDVFAFIGRGKGEEISQRHNRCV